MKTAKKKLNVRLLRKIQRHILEKPKRFLMSSFVERGRPGTGYFDDAGATQRFESCGTAACIAGWACLLGTDKRVRNHELNGAELLGLETIRDNYRDSNSAKLFYVCNWPDSFRREYDRAASPQTRAKIAAARIDHFIATKGAE